MSEKTRKTLSWLTQLSIAAVLIVLFFYVKSSSKKAEQDSLLMNLLQATNTMVLKVDRSASIREVAGANLLKYSISELTGKSLGIIMPENLKEFHTKRLGQAFDSKIAHVSIMACQAIDKDGSAVPISVRVYANTESGVAIALINLQSEVVMRGQAAGPQAETAGLTQLQDLDQR